MGQWRLLVAVALAALTLVAAAPPSSAYVAMVDRVLNTMDPKLRAALYDESVLLDAALKPCPADMVAGPTVRYENSAAGPDRALLRCVLPRTRMSWSRDDVYHKKVGPLDGFGSPLAQIRFVKSVTSVAVGRLHRDAELARQYDALVAAAKGQPVADSSVGAFDAEAARLGIDAFESSVAKVIAGYVRVLQRGLQLAVDGTARGSQQRAELKELLDLAARAPHKLPRKAHGWAYGPNPIDRAPKFDKSQKALEDSDWNIVRGQSDGKVVLLHDDAEVPREAVASAVVSLPARGVWPSFVVDLAWTHADALANLDHVGSTTFNRRFWANNMRSHIKCRHQTRGCEMVEICRRMCNPEYLLYGRADPRTVATGKVKDQLLVELASAEPRALPPPRAVHFVGWGSNNEYEWEDSLVRMFSVADPTTNDGGVNVGAAAFAKAEPKNVLDSLTTFDCTVKELRPTQQLKRSSIWFGLSRTCIASGAPRMSGNGGFISVKSQRRLVTGQLPDFPPVERVHPRETVEARRTPGWTRDDQMSSVVMKMDVEGFEHVAVPDWLHEELAEVGDVLKSKGVNAAGDDESSPGFAMIDFDALPSFPYVPLLLLELHRARHVHATASIYWGDAFAQHTMLHVAALGYQQYDEEKNYMDDCCAELTFVHYRYFVTSETWAAMRDLAL